TERMLPVLIARKDWVTVRPSIKVVLPRLVMMCPEPHQVIFVSDGTEGTSHAANNLSLGATANVASAPMPLITSRRVVLIPVAPSDAATGSHDWQFWIDFYPKLISMNG